MGTVQGGLFWARMDPLEGGSKKYPCQERNEKFLGAGRASEGVLGGVLGRVEYCTRRCTKGQN
jgi:hypothetical protein